jgi:hypothetical protein
LKELQAPLHAGKGWAHGLLGAMSANGRQAQKRIQIKTAQGAGIRLDAQIQSGQQGNKEPW